MPIQDDPLVGSLDSLGSPASITGLIECHQDMVRRALHPHSP